jgi:hypothetical protein
MLDFFDERYWWNQPTPRSEKPFEWCAIHNYYYTPEEGQTCPRCETARKARSSSSNTRPLS